MKEQVEALVSMLLSAWRFRWTALGTAWLVAILGGFVVLALPGKYQSTAQIYVDSRSILRPLLQGLAVTPETQDQTDVVRRALLARPSLEEVGRKVGLYTSAQTPETQEKLLTDLAAAISLHGDTATGIYAISYTSSNPETARKVVQTLLDTFMTGSLGAGRHDTQNAESFLKEQVAQYSAALSQSEQKLADFKKKNFGLMPDQRGDYFGRLQTELASQQKIHSDLAVAQRQRDALRAKLAGQDNGTALLNQAPPTAQEIQSATVVDARIRDSRRQLDELLLKFTDKHPEVIAMRETIRRLEEQRRAELGGVRQTNGTATEGSSIPVDPVVQNLQIALNGADVQVATLQTQDAQSDARVAELQKLVTTGPEVEAELARLNRDYGVTKTQYEALLARLGTARLSNEADRSEDSRFKILEPPRAPLRPISPDRLMFLIGVLFAALVVGAGVALLRALTQPVYFSQHAIAKSTGLPVIGVVTRSRTPSQLGTRFRSRLMYAAATALLVCAVLAAGAASFKASHILRHAIGLERA
jgi:polysaccharide chain length determinant protein (PEP-CTERM system associated)